MTIASVLAQQIKQLQASGHHLSLVDLYELKAIAEKGRQHLIGIDEPTDKLWHMRHNLLDELISKIK